MPDHSAQTAPPSIAGPAEDAARAGVRRHLEALAAEPRPAGGEAESRARAYGAEALRALGFATREQRFSYSRWPGRWLVPALGAAWIVTLTFAARYGVVDRGATALGVLAAGLGLVALAARGLMGNAVLWLPFGRAAGVNLVATRGGDAPAVWLVAHLDTKSQPVSIATRMVGIVASLAVMALAVILASAQAIGWRGAEGVRDLLVNVPHLHADLSFSLGAAAWLWVALWVAGLVAALPVVASTVGRRSPGALDNASGVATVLGAAAAVPGGVPLGIVLTSAEELGLAGARAFARAGGAPAPAGVAVTGGASPPASPPRGARVAIDCDTIGDAGWTVAQWSGRGAVGRPTRVLAALGDAAAAQGIPLRALRVLPGLLTDGVALAAAGWEVATVSRGTLGALARIHTRRDGLDRVRGDGVAALAPVIAAAAVTLARR